VANPPKLRELFPRLGGVRIEKPSARKRRRGAVARRRPRILLRRKLGRRDIDAAVHREREIIARSEAKGINLKQNGKA
jgi:hypothetical protein